jgi:hypothetical protein
MALRSRPNRPVPDRAASPDLGGSDMEECEYQPTNDQNPNWSVATTGPRMPAGSAEGELGWLDPPMKIEKSQRVWSFSWARPVPAKAAEPNGQILDLKAIRAIDPWGGNGLVLKWRRWKVAYPEVHNLVLPDLNDQYSPEDLERRRLQNWAEEHIDDQEARQQQEDPAAPEEDE